MGFHNERTGVRRQPPMTHAGRCFLCFRGKASTHLAYHFMTVKTVSMDKPKSTNYMVFLRLDSRETKVTAVWFPLYQEEGTKLF
jgi:hypothetical protein